MAEQESLEVKLARIEEHVKSIKDQLDSYPVCRHLNADGDCIFIDKLNGHDAKINQWTGALAAVALICSMLGALIGTIIAKVLR